MALAGRTTASGYRVLPSLFVAVGLILLVLPPAALQLSDWYAARRHEAEVARWLQQSRSVPRPAATTVIEPGPEGYLLEIPRIGVRAIVHELKPQVFSGRNTPRLREFGVGQVPFTSNLRNVSPGADGTAAVTGHRTTSGAPFRHIDRLRPGDLVVVRKGGLEQRWAVERSVSVPPHEVQAIASHPGVTRLALLACNPPYSARERLIVYARPVSLSH